jgi:thiamine-phosphate pyrophosphorylase
MPKPDLTLYALVDADNLDPGRLPELARMAADNGATLIQYRDKRSPARLMVERARAIRSALIGSGVPFLVNDRVDVAMASGADGVHLGRDDMAPADARRLLGHHAIIGATVKADIDLITASGSAVDYACIGGVFATLSKVNPDPPLGLSGLADLLGKLRTRQPDIPIGAIAGIGEANASKVMEAGAAGVAVISAIFGAADPAAAARRLRAIVDAARRPA